MKHLAQQDPDSTKEREETASMTKKELEARLDGDLWMALNVDE